MKRANALEDFSREFLLGQASEWTLQTVWKKYGVKLPAGTTNFEVLKSVFPGQIKDDRQTKTVL